MKRYAYGAAALVATMATCAPAFAGSLADPVVDNAPVIQPVPVPTVSSGEWTGFYTGLQLGYGDADGPGDLDGNNELYGFHAGYDYDLGDWVIGGELDYDKADIDLGDDAASVDSVARFKLKGGYDLGNTLVYATAGAARADTSLGNETGPFAGVGVTYKVTERYTIGAELLEHRFNDVDGVDGDDLDATTFTVRGSIRF